jgi:hypothetical protein
MKEHAEPENDAPKKKTRDRINLEGFGNTLDYYNDDMPIKATSKLFDETTEVPDDDEIVKGYDKENKEELPHPPEPEAPKPKEARRPEADRHERHARDEDPSYDLVRRSNPARRPVRSNSAEVPDKTSRPAPTRKSIEPAKVVRNNAQPLRSEQRRPRAEDGPRLEADQAEDFMDYDAPEGPGQLLRLLPAAACVVLLIILAVLVYQVNSVSAKLTETELKLRQMEDTNADVNQLRMRNEDLERQVEDLLAQMATMVEAPDPVLSDPSAPEPTPTPEPTASGERFYTVQSGDNLSKISEEMYGSSGSEAVQKIVQANDLQLHSSGNYYNIFPGQTLRIP